MKGLGHHFGGSGAPFWSHFGGLGGFWLPNASWKASWAALGRFSEPRWLQLGAQEGPKLEPKRCKNWWENRSKIRWLWKSIFERILVDFGKENGGKLAPKSEPKSILALKRTNQLNASPLMPNWVRRVQVGSKNQSKIDLKKDAETERLGTCILLIFDRFCFQLGTPNPTKLFKNRCQDAFHLGLHVWIDFWLIFASTWDPLNPIWH